MGRRRRKKIEERGEKKKYHELVQWEPNTRNTGSFLFYFRGD